MVGPKAGNDTRPLHVQIFIVVETYLHSVTLCFSELECGGNSRGRGPILTLVSH